MNGGRCRFLTDSASGFGSEIRIDGLRKIMHGASHSGQGLEQVAPDCEFYCTKQHAVRKSVITISVCVCARACGHSRKTGREKA
jgi:hypothetical protein